MQEHTGDRSVDQIIDSPVAQIRGFNVEMEKATPEERLQSAQLKILKT